MTKKVLSGVLFTSLLSVLFVACSNFMNGKDFLDKLQTAIEYTSKEYVKIIIDSPMSCTETISPMVGEYANKYKCGDSFSLSFKTSDAWQFSKWSVIPEGAVSFEDIKSAHTTVTILQNGEITITPECLERPRITSYMPSASYVGVNRGSDIKIYFDKPISENAIYFSKEEIEEITGKKITEQKKKVDGLERYFYAKKYNPLTTSYEQIQNNLFYAYWIGDSVFYKNIEIHILGTKESLLVENGYFGSPYLEKDTCLVIPTNKDSQHLPLPENTEIEVVIGSDIFSKNNITLGQDYKFSYTTGRAYDIEGPVVKDDKGNSNVYITFLKNEVGTSLIPQEGNKNNQQKLTLEKIKDKSATIESLKSEGLAVIKSVSISDAHFVDASGIDEYYVVLCPIQNSIYGTSQTTTNLSKSVLCDGKKDDSYSSTDPESKIVFDFSNVPAEGIFELKFFAADVCGTETLFSFVYKSTNSQLGATIIHNKNIYVLLDNIASISESDFTFRIDSEDPEKATITPVAGKSLPVGTYLWVSAFLNLKQIDNDFDGECKTAFRGATSNKVTVTAENSNDSVTLTHLIKQKPSGLNSNLNQYDLLIYEDAFGNIKGFNTNSL